jgi:hypothetical protein
VNKLLQLAVVLPLVVLAACGPDEHLKVADDNFTAYVIDLINNDGSDQAPRPYAEFASLPDPDGDSNNTTAYRSLFP